MPLLQHFHHFHTGQFYSYSYSPKWLNKLSTYDKYPLLLFVNYDNVYGLVSGVNMHWLTVSQRARLIDHITKAYRKEDLQDWGKAINLSWQNIKLLGLPYMMAWRRYFPNRMRNIKALATKWDYEELRNEVIMNNTQAVIGVTPEYIQRYYAESMARKIRAQQQKSRESQKTIEKNMGLNIVW